MAELAEMLGQGQGQGGWQQLSRQEHDELARWVVVHLGGASKHRREHAWRAGVQSCMCFVLHMQYVLQWCSHALPS